MVMPIGRGSPWGFNSFIDPTAGLECGGSGGQLGGRKHAWLPAFLAPSSAKPEQDSCPEFWTGDDECPRWVSGHGCARYSSPFAHAGRLAATLCMPTARCPQWESRQPAMRCDAAPHWNPLRALRHQGWVSRGVRKLQEASDWSLRSLFYRSITRPRFSSLRWLVFQYTVSVSPRDLSPVGVSVGLQAGSAGEGRCRLRNTISLIRRLDIITALWLDMIDVQGD
jgi:hypothetical protein